MHFVAFQFQITLINLKAKRLTLLDESGESKKKTIKNLIKEKESVFSDQTVINLHWGHAGHLDRHHRKEMIVNITYILNLKNLEIFPPNVTCPERRFVDVVGDSPLQLPSVVWCVCVWFTAIVAPFYQSLILYIHFTFLWHSLPL